jgi:hypothetical protein
MASTKQAEVSEKDAATITGIDEARRMEARRRIDDLEYALVRTRDALRVIARSLGGIADGYASEEERRQGMTSDDVDMLYGAVGLLDFVACDCERTFYGDTERQG